MGFRGGKIKYKFGHEFYKESVGPMPIWIKNAECEVCSMLMVQRSSTRMLLAGLVSSAPHVCACCLLLHGLAAG